MLPSVLCYLILYLRLKSKSNPIFRSMFLFWKHSVDIPFILVNFHSLSGPNTLEKERKNVQTYILHRSPLYDRLVIAINEDIQRNKTGAARITTNNRNAFHIVLLLYRLLQVILRSSHGKALLSNMQI